MLRELQVFLTAVMFFTKIPCPSWVDHSPGYLNSSSRYFSLVGIIVGGVGGAVYYASHFLFSHSISIILSMLSTVWLTGAFHEDGLADMLDGFGGGWTKEQILEIMNDSRVGTFGVVGLTGILALKFFSLREISPSRIPIVLIAGHALSRFLATTLNATHDYARQEASKAKPAAKEMSSFSLLLSGFFGMIPLIFFSDLKILLSLIPPVLVIVYLGYFYKKWIGGFTGDCSGAAQQLTEITFYLSLLAIWTFI